MSGKIFNRIFRNKYHNNFNIIKNLLKKISSPVLLINITSRDAEIDKAFVDEALKLILSQMRLLVVDGIKYTKIGDNAFYAQELFETEELFGYLSKNMIKADKSIYEYVVYDSENEETFARKFEENNQVKLYCKLPDWFKIPTPLGSYNPDWAVPIEEDGKERLYFVIETKGSILSESLRQLEEDKIKCGRKHFEALEADAVYVPLGANDFESFIESSYSRAERWRSGLIN